MQLERLPSAQAVAERAVERVAETLRAKPAAVLLLPAGATPLPFYAELVRRGRARTLDLSRAHIFQLDELAGVAAADARGFQAFFHAHLVTPLGLGARFHALDGRARDPAAEIERHRSALEVLGGGDLALLGLGKNGHVAFNEPGSTQTERARVVTLGATTRAGLRAQFANDCPHLGLTLGMAEIVGCKEVVLLVTGAAKAEMLARVLKGPPTSACPATLLTAHARFLVLADVAAAPRAPSR
ncbi:MAG: glucosamine-6-phosphate deaminase [Planctomycetes bacterium]|nr:glucosamine-6-phosphate deaminase [Planctomycetota bacterium]